MNAHTPFNIASFVPSGLFEPTEPPIVLNITINGDLYLGDDNRQTVNGDAISSTSFIEREPDFYVAPNGDAATELSAFKVAEGSLASGTVPVDAIEGFADGVRAVLRAEASPPALVVRDLTDDEIKGLAEAKSDGILFDPNPFTSSKIVLEGPALGVGRIVHYHPTWDDLPSFSTKLPAAMAALVTGVFLAGDNETPMASLVVFPPGQQPFVPKVACLEGDATKPGTWSWPPRN